MSKSKLHYARRTVGQLSWCPCPDLHFTIDSDSSAGRPGDEAAVAVRVARTRKQTLLPHLRLTQLGGPGSCTYIATPLPCSSLRFAGPRRVRRAANTAEMEVTLSVPCFKETQKGPMRRCPSSDILLFRTCQDGRDNAGCGSGLKAGWFALVQGSRHNPFYWRGRVN
jgi:hypothetical protein